MAPDRTTSHLLDAATLTELMRTGPPVRVLDVRSPAEFEAAHVRGSYNLPLDLLAEHRDELAEAMDHPVVLVCRSGQRATRAADHLTGAGLPGVKVLAGGVTDLDDSLLVHGRKRWDLERQVRLVAGGIVLTAALGSLVVPPLTWVAAAIGAGLAGAALTDSCAMGALLSRLPYNRRAGHDPQQVLRQLVRADA